MKYTIGQMAEIFNISTQTLRYYDSIKLFSPMGREENNHRYYLQEQIHDLRSILFLKEIGVSLKDIIKYKENKNLNNLYEILSAKNKNVEDEMRELERLNKILKEKIFQIEQCFLSEENSEVKIKFIEQRNLYLVKKNFSYLELRREIENLIYKMYQDMKSYKDLKVENLGTVINRENLLSRNLDLYNGIFMLQDNKVAHKTVKVEAGEFACIYHKGNYKDIKKSYLKILDYVKRENLKIGDFSMEVADIDIKLSSDPNNFITEIQIPIISK